MIAGTSPIAVPSSSTRAGTTARGMGGAARMIEFQGSSPIRLRASGVQEQRSVPHKQLGILKLRPVIRVGVDDELRIRDVLLHDEGVDRGHDHVVTAVHDECWLLDRL